MGYNVKWVEDNLGITRKALKGYEQHGLMPKNMNKKARNYDDDDLNRIWGIRVLQGMGYTLKEISLMIQKEDFDFEQSLGAKIEELEVKRRKLEQHLGYAKTIKFTGRFPCRPNTMGEVQFDEFHKQSLEKWNMENDPRTEEYQKIAETFLEKTPEELENTDLGRMLFIMERALTIGVDTMLIEYVLPKVIARKVECGVAHPEVQLMVKMLYENMKTINQVEDMSVKEFARIVSTSFMSGDISKIKTNNLSKKESEFIAGAIAYFGGYETYEALVEEEYGYGHREEKYN